MKHKLMSATMPVEDFRKVFPDPPQVINVSSRQFKVSTQFSVTIESHYINEAYKKVIISMSQMAWNHIKYSGLVTHERFNAKDELEEQGLTTVSANV